MHRRHFLRSGLAGTAALTALPTSAVWKTIEQPSIRGSKKIAGYTHEELAAELRRQLFEEYLPFWERGAYDEELGGFMCYLYDDGSVQDDRKDIWYQGRGIWVYAFLHNYLDPNPKWLEMARKSRDFMVMHMHRGDGTWIDTVDRMGKPVEALDISRGGNIYGALFAAVGLIQLANATGSDEDLQLAKQSIRKAAKTYEDPKYAGITVADTGKFGLRTQGHSFMFIWTIAQLLELGSDHWFEMLLQEHLEHIRHDFWNPDYGISNETLFHDYSRIPGLADQMVPGHSIETQWMAMDAAARFGDEVGVEVFRGRMRRLIEMSWDHVFGGIGDTDFRVFASQEYAAGPEFGIKAMWAQTEVLVGTMKVYADTSEVWTRDWYERTWNFTQRTMRTGYGVWRQAVNRQGKPLERPGISPYRKGNFHQPRCLMLNLLNVERIINH